MNGNIRYVVCVNSALNDSISFEVILNSLKEVAMYLGSMPQGYNGHVEKCIVNNGTFTYTNILKF